MLFLISFLIMLSVNKNYAIDANYNDSHQKFGCLKSIVEIRFNYLHLSV